MADRTVPVGRAYALAAEAARNSRVESCIMSRPRPLTFLKRVAMVSRHWCGTIAYLDANGPGGVTFGWFVFDAEPRRLVHVPMADLLSGCTPLR